MAPPPPFLPPSPSLPIRLTLPAHPSLALTPYTYNPAERADLVALQNQPVLARYNYGRAFPYTEAALDSFLARRGAGFDRGLGELLEWLGWGGDGEAGGASGREEEQPPIMMFPLACLRYLPPSPGPNTHEDGPADPLAALDLRPGQVVGLAFVYPSERHPSEKEGRAEQVFGLSYDIDERLHGQKVGKGMVQRLLEWTDWMGVRLLVVSLWVSDILRDCWSCTGIRWLTSSRKCRWTIRRRWG